MMEAYQNLIMTLKTHAIDEARRGNTTGQKKVYLPSTTNLPFSKQNKLKKPSCNQIK